jgi:hypothetical protein
VKVSKPGVSPSEAQAIVTVVPGMPAVVNIPPGAQLDFVNPKEGVTIPAVVMNTREGCRMWWSVQQEPGHEYFNLAEVVGLGDTVLVTLEEAKDKLGRLVVHYLCFYYPEGALSLRILLSFSCASVYLPIVQLWILID